MPQADDRAAYPLDGPMARELTELTSRTINTQSGTSYVAQASDWGRRIEMTNGSANTVEIPAGLPESWWCIVRQAGGGQTTIAAGSGATVNSYSSQLKIAGQWASATIERRTSTVYVAEGALVP